MALHDGHTPGLTTHRTGDHSPTPYTAGIVSHRILAVLTAYRCHLTPFPAHCYIIQHIHPKTDSMMADDDVYRERYSTVYPVYDGGYDDAPEPSGEYHDISRGAWRSAIIKFVRIGWLDGLEEAARHTSESDVKYLLKRQVWEDLMPAPDELEQVYRAIEEFDLERYLSFETHHSKQLVGGDDDGEPMTEPVLGNLFWHAHEEVDDGPKMGLAAALDVYVPNIVFDCLWAWNEVKEHIPSGGRREVCTEPWEGLPTIVCDEHTKEGRIWGVEATLVSGHPRMHRELSKRVHLTGWQAVWDEVFSSPVVHNNQQDMFDDA